MKEERIIANYERKLFNEFRKKLENCSNDANLKVKKINGKSFYIIVREGCSKKAIELFHREVFPRIKGELEKCIFIIDEGKERRYFEKLAKFLEVPIKNPIVNYFDKKVIEKAVKSGLRREEIYFSIIVDIIQAIWKSTGKSKIDFLLEAEKETMDEILKKASELVKVRKEYLKLLVAKYYREEFLTSKKYFQIEKKLREISVSMSRKRFFNILKRKKEIFVIFIKKLHAFLF